MSRRGFYFAHELPFAIAKYMRDHSIPASQQKSVANRLVYMNWQAAKKYPSQENNVSHTTGRAGHDARVCDHEKRSESTGDEKG